MGQRNSPKGWAAVAWHRATALALTAAVSLVGCGKTAHESGTESDASGGAGAAGATTATIGNEQTSADQIGIGSPLSPEQATLHPAGCPAAIEDECEDDEIDGASRLVTLPAPPSAFDATPTEQVFAVCSTVYVQPRAGCVRPLGVAGGPSAAWP